MNLPKALRRWGAKPRHCRAGAPAHLRFRASANYLLSPADPSSLSAGGINHGPLRQQDALKRLKEVETMKTR